MSEKSRIEIRRQPLPYTNVQNQIIWDPRLRPPTRWLLIAMLSLPEDWDYSIRGLAAKTGISKDTLSRMLRELEEAGYLRREEQSREGGKFSQAVYVVTDVAGALGDPPDPEPPEPDRPPEPETPPPCPNSSDTAPSPCPNFSYTENSPQQNNILTKYPPIVPPQGDGGEKPKKAGKRAPDREMFDRFWAAYPRKRNKDKAWRAWRKLLPDLETCRAMSNALERDKRSRQWTKDNGEYIPYASTWLNSRPWEDGDDGMPATEPVQPAPLRGQGVRYI